MKLRSRLCYVQWPLLWEWVHKSIIEDHRWLNGMTAIDAFKEIFWTLLFEWSWLWWKSTCLVSWLFLSWLAVANYSSDFELDESKLWVADSDWLLLSLVFLICGCGRAANTGLSLLIYPRVSSKNNDMFHILNRQSVYNRSKTTI